MTTPAPTSPELHPAMSSLAMLLGSWSGPGHGEYPTIEQFDYVETVTFGHVGKPFFAYGQRTRATDDGRPLHAETGFLRQPDDGVIELVIAHPNGIVEIEEGTFDGTTLTLRSTSVTRTSTAKRVDAIERTFTISVAADGVETIRYDLSMAAMGEPMTRHLAAELRRVPA